MSDPNTRDLMVDDLTTGRRPYNALLPLTRYTTAQRDALTAETGMVVYNTTTNKLNVYTGADWEVVTSS